MSFTPAEITPGVRFTSVYTSRGKSDSVSVSFRIPLDKRNLASAALVSKIISRGTAGFPDTLSINRECEDNYGTSVDIFYQKCGGEIVFTFLTSYLRSRYAFGGENIAFRALSMLREFIFSPLLTDGSFDAVYTAREKVTLLQQIASIRNNKPRYALKRAADIMCENEPFSMTTYNCADVINELTPRELADFFAYAVSDTPVEIIYAGETGRDEIIKLISSILPFTPRKSAEPSSFRTREVKKKSALPKKQPPRNRLSLWGSGWIRASTKTISTTQLFSAPCFHFHPFRSCL